MSSIELTIFGATGRTGRVLVRAALKRHWNVRALIRPSAQLEPASNLTILRGDLDNPDDVAAAIISAQAVCCVFGPRPPYRDVFCAQASQSIIQAMKRAGVHRLVCLTGAMIGDLPANVSWPMRKMAALFARRLPVVAADRASQEEAVMQSGLAWTLVKPPRLTDSLPNGRVSADPRLPVGLMSSITRQDLAQFLLDEVKRRHYIGQRVYVKG
jgi:putative NADH-flavin reductase